MIQSEVPNYNPIIERYKEQEESEESEKSMSNFSQHIDQMLKNNEEDDKLKEIAQYYEQLQSQLLRENSELKQRNNQLQSEMSKTLKRNMHRRCSSDPNEAIFQSQQHFKGQNQDPQFEQISFIEKQYDSTTQNDSFTMQQLQQQLYGGSQHSQQSSHMRKPLDKNINLNQIQEETEIKNQQTIQRLSVMTGYDPETNKNIYVVDESVQANMSCFQSAFPSAMQTPVARSPKNSVKIELQVIQQEPISQMGDITQEVLIDQAELIEEPKSEKKRDQCCIIF